MPPLCHIPTGPLHKRQPCEESRCAQWVTVRGTHPQTGAEMDHSACSFSLGPLLAIENAKEIRQTAAAVESLRNLVAGATPPPPSPPPLPPPS